MRNKKNKTPAGQLFFSRTWDFLNVYLIKQAGRSPATAESYRDSLTVFKNYLTGELGSSIGTFQFSDCTKECIYGYREYLLGKGIQPSTVNVRVAAIRSYLNYAADMNVSVQSIALVISQISPCRTIIKEKAVLTEEALAALLSAPPHTRAGIRERAILVLLYDTAMRVSELLNVRLCDIASDKRYLCIFITGKGNKERTVQLTDEAAGHLNEYLRIYHGASPKDAYLFSTTIKGVTDRMSVGNVQRIIKKYAAQVRAGGVELPESVHCHMFRNPKVGILCAGQRRQTFIRMAYQSSWSRQCLAMPVQKRPKTIMQKLLLNSFGMSLNQSLHQQKKKNLYGQAVKKKWPGVAD